VEPLTLFLAALGLAMFIEGLPYFVAPSGVKRWLTQVQSLRNGSLRLIGLALMMGGLLVAWVSLR
jgi:uncharacterized protein YjeT (DUF2065 family)